MTLLITSWERIVGLTRPLGIVIGKMSSVSLVNSRVPYPEDMVFKSQVIETTPIAGQEPGTSGLRKPVKVFQGKHYTENFVQSILNHVGKNLEGSSFVVGGDGRYYCKEVTQIIIKMCAANGVRHLYIGQNGILSTPAASHLIRKLNATGGIILTASHNPGGPDNDFGIKYNVSNGGPASGTVTQHIYDLSLEIKSYKIVPDLECPVDKICSLDFQIDGKDLTVNIIDSVNDYLQLVKDIFDFPKIKKLLTGSEDRPPFKILIDCMHGVTGPYAERIFLKELGAFEGSVINSTPLQDFGGGHPDPNLVYAKKLVLRLEKDEHDFGAAFDGDGDRNMILGRKAFFVTPSDSLAVLAEHLHCIPYFQKNGIKGFARSMPTAAAVDRIAQKKGLGFYETPTGWKYFGTLLDAGNISLCGEESFGTGSTHIREKDGIWAALAWLSVIAHLNKSVPEIVEEFWINNGRNYALRYDYENVGSQEAKDMMASLETLVTSSNFYGKEFGEPPNVYQVSKSDNFQYTDPIDNSTAKRQGIRIIFSDGSRIIFRLSGTGSTGATVRIYFEQYEKNPEKTKLRREVVMENIVKIALQLSKIQELTKRDSPTVIT